MGHEERAAEASRRMWQAGSASVGVTPNRVLGEGAPHFLEPNDSINRRVGKVGRDLGILSLPAAQLWLLLWLLVSVSLAAGGWDVHSGASCSVGPKARTEQAGSGYYLVLYP